MKWYESDAAVEDHYRRQFRDVNGYDPLDPYPEGSEEFCEEEYEHDTREEEDDL